MREITTSSQSIQITTPLPANHLLILLLSPPTTSLSQHDRMSSSLDLTSSITSATDLMIHRLSYRNRSRTLLSRSFGAAGSPVRSFFLPLPFGPFGLVVPRMGDAFRYWFLSAHSGPRPSLNTIWFLCLQQAKRIPLCTSSMYVLRCRSCSRSSRRACLVSLNTVLTHSREPSKYSTS